MNVRQRALTLGLEGISPEFGPSLAILGFARGQNRKFPVRVSGLFCTLNLAIPIVISEPLYRMIWVTGNVFHDLVSPLWQSVDCQLPWGLYHRYFNFSELKCTSYSKINRAPILQSFLECIFRNELEVNWRFWKINCEILKERPVERRWMSWSSVLKHLPFFSFQKLEATRRISWKFFMFRVCFRGLLKVFRNKSRFLLMLWHFESTVPPFSEILTNLSDGFDLRIVALFPDVLKLEIRSL